MRFLFLFALFCCEAIGASLDPSKVVITDSGTHLVSYAGTACTNQALYSLSAAGVGSCVSAALTKTDDTNVTLTLGGSPTNALLNATSLTLGWTGKLGLARGGTNADLSATGGTSQVLKQVSSGAAVTVGRLACADLSDSAGGCSMSTTAGGDLTGTLPNPTLAAVITAGGPTGSATVAPIITYDAKGRLTAVSSATIAPAVGSITGLGTGVATALAINVGSAGAFTTFNGAHGTPSSITLTNATGTAASLTAGNVTTNANLTGPITSSGNATAVASQTGTGTKFVMDTSPTLVTPTLGVATASSINFGGTALSNYTEGTWTPTLTPSGGSLTAYTSGGFYTKIGNVCTVVAYVKITNAGTASGVGTIGAFPCTAKTVTAGAAGTAAVREQDVTGNTYVLTMASGATTAILNGINWTNAYNYTFSMTYLTN